MTGGEVKAAVPRGRAQYWHHGKRSSACEFTPSTYNTGGHPPEGSHLIKLDCSGRTKITITIHPRHCGILSVLRHTDNSLIQVLLAIIFHDSWVNPQ